MVDEPINLPDLEQVIPYVRARAIIQQNPDHILLVKCPCRMSKEDPCLPLEACLVIGEPFASFTLQHYPSRARWITQEEACTILEEEDARGRVHHAFFSEMMLGRLFASAIVVRAVAQRWKLIREVRRCWLPRAILPRLTKVGASPVMSVKRIANLARWDGQTGHPM
jgi:hypothetical protein